jgi:hypothetical protein
VQCPVKGSHWIVESDLKKDKEIVATDLGRYPFVEGQSLIAISATCVDEEENVVETAPFFLKMR